MEASATFRHVPKVISPLPTMMRSHLINQILEIHTIMVITHLRHLHSLVIRVIYQRPVDIEGHLLMMNLEDLLPFIQLVLH